MYELELKQQNKLENDLLRARTKHNTKLLEYRKFSNYQTLIEQLNKHNLGLNEPEEPPIKVKK
jgi:hypothetical protein